MLEKCHISVTCVEMLTSKVLKVGTLLNSRPPQRVGLGSRLSQARAQSSLRGALIGQQSRGDDRLSSGTREGANTCYRSDTSGRSNPDLRSDEITR